MPVRLLSRLLPLVVIVALAGCSQKADKPADQAGAPQTYQVEGTIQQLPTPGAAERTVVIQHEEIPDFVNAQGKKTGMKAMTMPFPVANDVSLEGLAVGDRVHFTLVVNWTGSPRFQVTKLDKVQ